MSVGLALAISLVAMFLALPMGVAAAACAVVAHKERRRDVVLVSAGAALVSAIATLLLPLGLTQVVGTALLLIGAAGAAVAAALILLRRGGAAPGTVVGLVGAPLATAGHLMESAPALAGLVPLATPGGAAVQADGLDLVLGSGLAVGALTVLAVIVVLLLLRRLGEMVTSGIAVGAGAAGLATIAQVVLHLLRSQVPQMPAFSPGTTLMLTVLGLVIGTLLGVMRADRSGALAGMPPGNH